jgi:hypothetical protein
VNIVTVGSGIAVRNAAPPPDSSSIGVPTAGTSGVRKAGKIIVIGSRSTGAAGAGRA